MDNDVLDEGAYLNRPIGAERVTQSHTTPSSQVAELFIAPHTWSAQLIRKVNVPIIIILCPEAARHARYAQIPTG